MAEHVQSYDQYHYSPEFVAKLLDEYAALCACAEGLDCILVSLQPGYEPPWGTVNARCMKADLDTALLQLPHTRHVLVQQVSAGISHEQVAAALGLVQSTVTRNFQRSCRNLAKLMNGRA